MKKIQVIFTAWIIAFMCSTFLVIATNTPSTYLMVFFGIILTVVSVVLAIWESVTWANQETANNPEYINGPYFWLLRERKKDKRQSWSEYDVTLDNLSTDYDEIHNSHKTNKPVNKKTNRKLRTFIWLSVIFILVIIITNLTKILYGDVSRMYNKSKIYQNAYSIKVEEKKGFYDKLWKTYLVKEKISNINKDVFLTTARIIMESRRDGANVAWKWTRETQQIPFEEFTKFYANLSDFITSQREGYFNIEKECMAIANANNTLLDTLPNNIYNHFVKLPRIQFQYGFLSDSTINVFNSGKENVK